MSKTRPGSLRKFPSIEGPFFERIYFKVNLPGDSEPLSYLPICETLVWNEYSLEHLLIQQQEQLPHLQCAEELVIAEREVTLKYNYPLQNPVSFKYKSKNGS
jgi:hypothetical protein